MLKVRCMNKDCGNYNQELDENIDVCPLCGITTEKTESGTKNALAIAAIVAAVVSLVIFWRINFYVGLVLEAACVALGFISKSKPAIVITILCMLISGGVLANFIINTYF